MTRYQKPCGGNQESIEVNIKGVNSEEETFALQPFDVIDGEEVLTDTSSSGGQLLRDKEGNVFIYENGDVQSATPIKTDSGELADFNGVDTWDDDGEIGLELEQSLAVERQSDGTIKLAVKYTSGNLADEDAQPYSEWDVHILIRMVY